MKTYRVSVIFTDPTTGQRLARSGAEVSGNASPEDVANRVAMETIDKLAVLQGRSVHWDWQAEEI